MGIYLPIVEQTLILQYLKLKFSWILTAIKNCSSIRLKNEGNNDFMDTSNLMGNSFRDLSSCSLEHNNDLTDIILSGFGIHIMYIDFIKNTNSYIEDRIFLGKMQNIRLFLSYKMPPKRYEKLFFLHEPSDSCDELSIISCSQLQKCVSLYQVCAIMNRLQTIQNDIDKDTRMQLKSVDRTLAELQVRNHQPQVSQTDRIYRK